MSLPAQPSRTLHAVLFDFDGTLTLPGHLDFGKIRNEMGCPQSVSILDYLSSIADEKDRSRATRVLERAEATAASASVPRPGMEEYVDALRTRGVCVGVLTRNSRKSVARALENFLLIDESWFDVVISRDDAMRYKPHPDGVLHAARRFSVSPQHIVVVGDYRYDMEAARAASALAVYLDNSAGSEAVPDCDAVVQDVPSLRTLLAPMLVPPLGQRRQTR